VIIAASSTPNRRLAYAMTVLGIVLGSLVLSPLQEMLDLSNVALFYVLLVVLIGAKFGRGPAIICATLGSLAFAIVFVPPGFSMVITEWQEMLTAAIMLVVALLVGHLTSALRAHAQNLEGRAADSAALYELATDLAGKQSSGEVQERTCQFFCQTLHAMAPGFVFPDRFDSAAAPLDAALIRSCLAQRHLLFATADEEGRCLAVLPLFASGGAQGIVHFSVPATLMKSLRFSELAETVASLVAVALERTHFAEVARQSELAKVAQDLRCSILASLSHDIRTPLTALVGTADTLLLSGKLDQEKQKSLLGGLRDQAESIHHLVVNLLEMTRLQTGAVELNRAWQPIEEVLGATLKLAGDMTGQRTVAVAIEPGLPPLLIDAVLIERVLWNLLENACKYSPESSPIELSATRQGDFVDVAVLDRGPGLPPGREESIFRLFQRGDGESNIAGAGLGLAIARSITDAHQGQLLAKNRPDGGSSFHLLLPIGSPPELELEN
jgi:two-component system sensor histidine kinase KdpD